VWEAARKAASIAIKAQEFAALAPGKCEDPHISPVRP
jgi:hypothetical protein